MKLWEKLIELRKEKGWSQEEFAEKLDISRQAVSRWENGTALPDAQNLLRISKLFNVTADYLLNDEHTGEINTPSVAAVMAATVPSVQKKKFKRWYLIPIFCIAILAACAIIIILIQHQHPVLNVVKENEVAPTCSSEGSYDEVVYCADCNEEITRTTKKVAQLAHTLSSSVKENEIAATYTAEGLYDEVVYCADCNEEITRTTKKVAKLAHTLSSSVKENEIAATCTAEGSYDEVVYCAECNAELLRTHRNTEIIAHQYQNKKCIACDKAQPSEGLLYMSNGNGTCFVSVGDCTDENIVIPEYSPDGDTVTKIKAYAFAGNSNIKSVLIPETVTVIGEAAFEDCINLESVNLPSKITTINSYTFNGCEKLNGVTIPTGVTYIGEKAFADCLSFESIVIPANVTKIGAFAFKSFFGGQGTVTFEVYKGWKLYDSEGNFVDIVDFSDGVKPELYIIARYCEYAWKRD